MAVTLEEWNSLNLWFEKSGLRIAYGCGQTNAHLRDLLRSEGVRRDNVRCVRARQMPRPSAPTFLRGLPVVGFACSGGQSCECVRVSPG